MWLFLSFFVISTLVFDPSSELLEPGPMKICERIEDFFFDFCV